MTDDDSDDCDDDCGDCDDEGFYECEDLDIRLWDGEVRARLRKMERMDDQGYCESSPLEVDLCPTEAKELRYKMRRGITAESGAEDCFIHRRMMNHKNI